LLASSISFPTKIEPAIPIPRPNAAPVTAAVFLFDKSLGSVDSKKVG